MISKINILDIIRDHLRTLVHEHNGKTSVGDYLLFFGLPIIVAALLLWLKGVFGPNVGGVLITAFSISPRSFSIYFYSCMTSLRKRTRLHLRGDT
jgi:hypothetical protein